MDMIMSFDAHARQTEVRLSVERSLSFVGQPCLYFNTPLPGATWPRLAHQAPAGHVASRGGKSGLSNKPIFPRPLCFSLNKPISEEPEAHTSGAYLLLWAVSPHVAGSASFVPMTTWLPKKRKEITSKPKGRQRRRKENFSESTKIRTVARTFAHKAAPADENAASDVACAWWIFFSGQPTKVLRILVGFLRRSNGQNLPAPFLMFRPSVFVSHLRFSFLLHPLHPSSWS